VNETDIAIVGIAGRFPGADDVHAFWSLVTEGREGVSRFTAAQLQAAGVAADECAHPAYQPVSGVVRDADRFDAGFFGYSPAEATLIDPQQRVFLECAWHALEDAQYVPNPSAGVVGVYAGASTSTYVDLLEAARRPDDWASEFHAAISNKSDFLPSRVSYKLDLRGPSLNVQTGCSTSLVAVHLACQGLLTGETDVALAGGASIRLPQEVGYVPMEGSIQSQDGHCRPFDHRSSGVISGNGVAVVVLKRLADAQESGDRIYAVIRATAVGNDGNEKIGFTAPSEVGQVRTIRSALDFAGIDASSVGYIEAHGTATSLGDQIECSALAATYGAAAPGGLGCKLGSVKANIGHLDSAAGVTGLIKAALALHHRVLPPLANFERPHPALPLAQGRLHADARLQPWPALPSAPRRAAVNSLGIGGTNAHAILEEAPDAPAPAAPALPSQAWTVLPFSARDPAALDRLQASLAAVLAEGRSAADLCHALIRGRKRHPHRGILLAGGAGDAARALPPVAGSRSGAKLAFMFPGGGTQYAGMGAQLYRDEEDFRVAAQVCADALAGTPYGDLLDALQPGAATPPAAAAGGGTSATARSLLLVCTVDYAVARMLMGRGLQPSYLLGHSVGEYVAAVIAGCMTLTDALHVVMRRGELLDELDDGRMIAVAAQAQGLRDAGLPDGVWIAAENAPRLCTLSGPAEAIARFGRELDRRGTEWWPVPLAVAAHSAMLDPILPAFRDVVSKVRLSAPRLPLVSNVDGEPLSARDACDPDYWVRQFRQTVRFSDAVTTVLRLGGGNVVFAEVGPGKVLSGFVAGHDSPGLAAIAVPSMRHRDDPVDDGFALAAFLGRLWQHGVDLRPERLCPGHEPRRVDLPAYPFARDRHWPQAAPARARREHAAAGVERWLHLPTFRRVNPPLPQPVAAGDADVLCIGANPSGVPGAVHAWEDLPATWPAGWRATVVDACIDHGLEATQPQQALTAMCLRLKRLCVAIGSAGSPLVLNIVTRGAIAVEGDGANLAGEALAAAVKVAAQEFSQHYIRHVDIGVQAPDARSQGVLRVLCRTRSADRQLVLRGGQCWVPAIERIADLPVAFGQPPAAPPALRDGAIVVLVGGAGKVGRHLAKYLATRRGARIALVNRRPASDADLARWARELGTPPERLLVRTADTCDATALAAVFDEVQARWGGIDGVVHLAANTTGRSIRRLLPELSAEDCAEQFGPKIAGVLALDRALAGRRLDWCFLFSSNAAVFGGIGQAAYAAANAFVDAFAAQRHRQGDARWISATWDGWRSDGEAYDDATSSLDVYAMPPELSFEAFERVATRACWPTTIVSRGEVQPRVERWLRLADAAPQAAEEAAPEIDVAEFADPIAQALAKVWRDLLEVPQVRRDSNFFDEGGHSLLGLQLIARVEAAVAVRVPFFAFSQTPTLGHLIEMVESRRGTPPADAAPTRAPAKAATLDDLLSGL
jgi:phthiocerol/phenolphthiocerol synthesis type-I polyketide synthase E